ncbi:MAG: hypothetical protein R3E09_19110 [Novosphingobium sp.]|nr:hypothetical protein [Novosphingobium sp.]
MNRILLGALAALLLVASGIFWWQGRAETEQGVPPPELALETDRPDPEAMPSADISGLKGPAPPEADELTREQRRFSRYDRDSDGRITRNEMLSTRTRAFRALDKDGNNLLTFEEWAVTTADRFDGADANGDLSLTPEEFATTRPKRKPKPDCRC